MLPSCSVTLSPPNLPPYIGVFGSFQQVALRLPVQLGETFRVLGQSLLSEEAVDVTRSVGWKEDGTLLIPGSLIETLYRPTATPGDLSDPSVVFALVKEETL